VECPHCKEKLPAAKCPHCEEEVLEGSVYCGQCGGLMELPPQDEGDDSFSNRVLCSDGTCIGVIGPDGKCKECGKPYRPGAEDD
jgi:hypothetical protein